MYDIYFIVKDECAFTAMDVFFHFYQELLDGFYRITVTEIKRNAEDTRSYFVLEDCYNNKYRLFVEKESDYLNKMNGVILGGELGLKNLVKLILQNREKALNLLSMYIVRMEQWYRLRKVLLCLTLHLPFILNRNMCSLCIDKQKAGTYSIVC